MLLLLIFSSLFNIFTFIFADVVLEIGFFKTAVCLGVIYFWEFFLGYNFEFEFIFNVVIFDKIPFLLLCIF